MESALLQNVYTQGLGIAAVAGPVVAGIAGGAVLARSGAKRLTAAGPGALALLPAGFLIAFPIVNLWELRDRWSPDLWVFELRTGLMAARAASAYLGIQLILYVLGKLGRSASDCGVNDELSQVVGPGTQALITGCQSLLYAGALFVGFRSVMYFQESTRMVALNWLVLFLISEWFVIADYMHHFRGRILTAHYLKVQAANLLIAGLMLNLLYNWQGFGLLDMTGWSVALVALTAVLIACGTLLFPATQRPGRRR
jgi:hypothetical protein